MIENLHDVLVEIEHNWSARRILVVGDVMLDQYIWGDVRRISPEAPVPVVRISQRNEQPGGAANVAMNLAKLGAQVMVVGYVGGDQSETLLTDCMRAAGIESLFIRCQGFPTILKLRILGGQQQMLRLDDERLDPRSDADAERLVAVVLKHIPQCDALVLSDYAKGVLTPFVCKRLIEAARQQNVPILVDPKSADFDRYRGATTVCPNLQELRQALHSESRNMNMLLDAAQSFASSFDLDFLTVTLSEKGIALLPREGRYLAPATARQVFDVSGAGDTVIAVLALCLSGKLDSRTAVQLANIAAGIVVGKVGTVPVEKHELLDALSSHLTLQAANKVVSREELRNRIAVWRANAESVVFTNGCFDLLHIGHIRLLEEARRAGGHLIVAINSDASVRRLKGPQRPIVGENERARVLAALAAVDLVVIFDEPTPYELILAIRPDVLVKGGDYDVETIVGAKEVYSWGGQVKIVPTVEGFSTTELIARGGSKDS